MKSHINETHFELYSQNYCEPDRMKSIWFVIWMCFLEYFLLWLEKKPLPLPKENLLSVCHGIFYYLIKLWIRSTEYFAYIWLWENYSLFPIWFSESWSSFFGTVIFVDFCYYWFHRFSHEVMIFWAIHQVHHLSLDLTVSVGIRHSPIQSLFSWVFYLPLAIIGLPVSHLKAHLHLNNMYQIWVHTEALDKIGPLEWVMNTPSHHRVHHGIIKRVIDKNYGGIFIIWDRLFGTFTPEENRDDNIYGVLYQTQSWNIFSQQTFYLQYAIEKAKTMSNGLEIFSTFWKGPSWEPGYSRLGRELEINYDYSLNRRKNKAYTSGITDLYIFMHIIALLCLLMKMTENTDTSITSSTAFSILIITALVNMGLIYEGRSIAGKIELLRCFAGVILVLIFPLSKWEVQLFILVLYSSSIALWLKMNLGNILINNLHKMN